ncbi:MAG: hypothetical protein H0X30_24960 [Anaerolineae bacterium]|nr:hypothetical protein [Anaerolineae bacterium]
MKVRRFLIHLKNFIHKFLHILHFHCAIVGNVVIVVCDGGVFYGGSGGGGIDAN